MPRPDQPSRVVSERERAFVEAAEPRLGVADDDARGTSGCSTVPLDAGPASTSCRPCYASEPRHNDPAAQRCRRFDPAAFGCASVAIGMRATIHDTLIPMRAGGRLGLIALGTYSRSVATAMAGQVSH
jgi:hypothetical protein